MSAQLTAGLPDDDFLSDGLLTKRVLRASALAALAPVGNELLWDLGAGTGSIGIEWCRLSDDNRAVAVERNAERLERIGANAARHDVADRLSIVPGDTTEVLERLPRPDAVCVGGSRALVARRKGVPELGQADQSRGLAPTRVASCATWPAASRC